MRNIKLIIQYDGSRYKGWQRLGDTDNTIQGKIESVLSKMTDENVEIIGSGRTDAGVHALNQIANFKTNSKMKVKEINDYLYKYLPDDIVVKSIEEIDKKFHSRYNAVSKIYNYRISNNNYHDVFKRKYCVHIPEKLNIEKMKQACICLIGEHDFTSFTTLKSKKKSKVREIYSINIEKYNNNIIDITFHGNGFLYNMIRIIIGTLLEVGHGKIKPEEVSKILNKNDRSFAGPTADAKGLFLVEVKY